MIDNPFKDAKGIKEKRKILTTYTKQVRQQQELDMGLAKFTVNEILQTIYKKDTEAKTFKTFKGWQKEGKRVIEGQKAWCLWTKPLVAKEQENKSFRYDYAKENETSDAVFFIAHVFSDLQVE